jgi:hypothetical protein
MSYKYEGFEVNQVIRSEDFAPREGRPIGQCYVEGVIEQVFPDGFGYIAHAHYRIRAIREVWIGKERKAGSRVGTHVIVPMQIAPRDWDGRVTLVTTEASKETDVTAKFVIVLEGAGGELDRVTAETERELNRALREALQHWDLRPGDTIKVLELED